MGALGYMKTLETDRLILRDWTLDDIGCDVYDEGTIRFLISARNNYAVVLKESGEVIGTIGITRMRQTIPMQETSVSVFSSNTETKV